MATGRLVPGRFPCQVADSYGLFIGEMEETIIELNSIVVLRFEDKFLDQVKRYCIDDGAVNPREFLGIESSFIGWNDQRRCSILHLAGT